MLYLCTRNKLLSYLSSRKLSFHLAIFLSFLAPFYCVIHRRCRQFPADYPFQLKNLVNRNIQRYMDVLEYNMGTHGCTNWSKDAMLVTFRLGAQLGNLLVIDCVSMPSFALALCYDVCRDTHA